MMLSEIFNKKQPIFMMILSVIKRGDTLTDTKLRNLKPRDKIYKANDRDGL